LVACSGCLAACTFFDGCFVIVAALMDTLPQLSLLTWVEALLL
jgi:hypothetical protein